MKKKTILACGAALLLSSCGFTGGTATNGANATDVLGGILGAITNTNTLGEILYEVIGASKLSERDVIGTWKYYQPGCAFTSENALAAAGGKVVAAEAKEKLLPTYKKLGIKSSNTYFTFNQDGTFSAKVMGKTISGTYKFNSSNSSVQMQTLLLSTTGYLTRNPQGISLLFESKKLLTALQVVGAASGNSTLGTVSEISKNYDGIRLGFDLSK
ncbi:MAG: DUF4923 family protein [Prevotella sp.]|nr:DUF4923 family protein [Prevotella sp.]